MPEIESHITPSLFIFSLNMVQNSYWNLFCQTLCGLSSAKLLPKTAFGDYLLYKSVIIPENTEKNAFHAAAICIRSYLKMS